MNDTYDTEIAWLQANPEKIYECWSNPNQPPYSYPADRCNLFKFVMPDGQTGDCGCLTQISRGNRQGWTREITNMIRADGTIPKWAEDINVNNLHIFAEWQRKVDKYFEELTQE